MRNKRTLIEHVLIGRTRRELLDKYSWYTNIIGEHEHPHCIDLMSRATIIKLTPAQLEYKLRHGSMAQLPENLLNNKKRQRFYR